MPRTGQLFLARRTKWLGCTALVAASAIAATAHAQTTENEGATLSEIVVTAQKRAQNLQDVPIAVTAMTGETLQNNRISNVADLNALAPNLIVRPTAGGQGLPQFTVRGIVSLGVVPGSDKEVSLYVDGVYLGATRGSLFDFAEIERIEMLRGPQGTLFGRNSTAGAVSIITPDPPGEFHVRQEFTYGNYDQFRSKTRVDTPQWGPLSATVSYLHSERRGDIKNLGAGARWDRTGMLIDRDPIGVSPKYLGNKNFESVFAALKFAPSDNFSMTYKFDYVTSTGSPDGVAPIGVNTGVAAGATVAAIIAAQPTPVTFVTDARRPKAVNNWWVVPSYFKNYGHSVTTQLRVNDNLSLKNILAYRYGTGYVTFQNDGLGGLVNTNPALGPLGAPFIVIGLTNFQRSKQWSDELQLNYDSKLVTVTAGAMYFKISDFSGPPPGLPVSASLRTFPGFRVPINFPAVGQSYNWSKSLAAYLQAEIHVTEQIDLVGGYRITKDDKTGVLYNPSAFPFTYEKAKPSYLAGVNYKPNSDILVYGKYSTGFVSGGSVSNIAFQPETAQSWEAGLKADLFDRRLRTNLALFSVKYRNLQSAQGGSNVGRPELSTLIIDIGHGKAKGFEAEVTAAPMRHLSLGGGLGYTDFKYTYRTPLALQLLGTEQTYTPPFRAKWTAQLWGQYETQPLFGDATLRVRVDANWRSKQRIDGNPNNPVAAFKVLEFAPAAWTVNARVGLQHLKVGGVEAEVAAWVKNLTNDDTLAYSVQPGRFVASAFFVPARTFGVDLVFKY